MSVETMLAMITEGSPFKIERSTGNMVEMPFQDVAGTLGAISREAKMHRSKRSAGIPTEFGLNILIARCTDHEIPKKAAENQAAALAWRMFWKDPRNKDARVQKSTFYKLARTAVEDHCNPGKFHGMTIHALARNEIGMNHETFRDRFRDLYANLKTELSRYEYPCREAFFRLLG